MYKKDDQVLTKSPLWHEGIDVGNRLAVVLDTTSYVVLEILGYENNPVKCFQNDVQEIEDSDDIEENSYESWIHNMDWNSFPT